MNLKTTSLIKKYSQYDDDLNPRGSRGSQKDLFTVALADINNFDAYKDFKSVNGTLKTTYRLISSIVFVASMLSDQLESRTEKFPAPHIDIDLGPHILECFEHLDDYTNQLIEKHQGKLDESRHSYISSLEEVADLIADLNDQYDVLSIGEHTVRADLEDLIDLCAPLVRKIDECLLESGDLSDPENISENQLEGKDTMSDQLFPYESDVDQMEAKHQRFTDRKMHPDEAAERFSEEESEEDHPMETDIKKLNHLVNSFLKLALHCAKRI